MRANRWIGAFCALVFVSGLVSCESQPSDEEEEQDVVLSDVWVYEEIPIDEVPVTLTDVWGRSDGTLFASGWFGTVLTNRVGIDNPEGNWVKMPTPTLENLTAIYGVENGGAFGLPDEDGEMVAVGWNGTILHYHPNPDGLPETDDGIWTEVAGPEVGFMTALELADPACADFDGDGVLDDGDGDGYWGNALCVGGISGGCDDNCLEAANGPLRPFVDSDQGGMFGERTGCIDNADMPDISVNPPQADMDADAVGATCDGDDFAPGTTMGFTGTLFDVWIDGGNTLEVVAVGEDGALVTYIGPSAANPPTPPTLPITDRAGWIAQPSVPFRYLADCPASTPQGQACAGERLPPSCASLCSPRKEDCTLANAGMCMGQCCSTLDPGCDAMTGNCGSFCAACFRRLDRTLRSVQGNGNTVIAVGAKGMVVEAPLSGIRGVWSSPTCVAPPSPLDEQPVLVAVSQVRGGGVTAVGAAGTIVGIPSGANSCQFFPLAGAPPAFLSDIFAVNGNLVYAVGDSGLLLEVRGGNLMEMETEIPENLHGIWVTQSDLGNDLLWMVASSGKVYRGCYVPPIEVTEAAIAAAEAMDPPQEYIPDCPLPVPEEGVVMGAIP